MSRLRALSLVLLLIPGCARNEPGEPHDVAGFVPGLLQPQNCGTPETPKPCKSTRKADGSKSRLRPVVLVQELGGAPTVAVAPTTVLRGDSHPIAELSSEASSNR